MTNKKMSNHNQMNTQRWFLFLSLVASLNVVLVFLVQQPKINRDIHKSQPVFDLAHSYNNLENFVGIGESVAVGLFDDNNDLTIHITGFKEVSLEALPDFLNSEMHVTEKLGLYSLNYIVRILRDNNEDLNNKKIEQIINSLQITLSHIERFTFVTDRMKFNDHVVAARLESLLLIKAFLKDRRILNDELSQSIDKHLKYCIIELLDDKKFTWRTNHGLMQIRSLLAFDFALKENRYSQKTRKSISSILRDGTLLDFHIAYDGSVFEAATGYWWLVYKQWERIAQFPQLKTDSVLQNRLKKTRVFLNATATNDGFWQGLGDSYSYKSDTVKPGETISAFRFANGLAGVNLTDAQEGYLQLLFVSLDNKPHVKKHPEDLALYVYWNQPLFINPGLFAWAGSKERTHVRSQAAQNTSFYQNYEEPDSSVLFMHYNDDYVLFNGMKWYNSEYITRRVRFCINSGSIRISDEGRSLLTTGFNIHPAVDIELVDSLTIQLKTKEKETIATLRSNVLPDITDTKISDKVNSMIQVKRIEYVGDTIYFDLNLMDYSDPDLIIESITNNNKTYQRALASELLSKKYWKSRYYQALSLKTLIIPRVFIFFGICILFWFFRKIWGKGQLVLYGFTILSIIDVIIYGMLFYHAFMGVYGMFG